MEKICPVRLAGGIIIIADFVLDYKETLIYEDSFLSPWAVQDVWDVIGSVDSSAGKFSSTDGTLAPWARMSQLV